MFRNLGKALSLLRELRGKSQAEIARAAGVGKSQISKYEKGRELPKLDSLARILEALGVAPQVFFQTLALVDEREAALSCAGSPLMPPAVGIPSLDEAFKTLCTDLLHLHRAAVEQSLFASTERGLGDV
jgi:transcriptional regulator with XRE-family HTH domain